MKEKKMEYKKIFKSWWFYTLICIYAIYKIFLDLGEYGNLYFVEVIGIIIGSFLGVLFIVTIFWVLIKFFKWLIEKVTKR